MRRYFTSLIVLLAFTVHAEQFILSNTYYGAGVSLNTLDKFDDAVGYQVFAGYEFDLKLASFTTAAEVGYMDSGDFELNTSAPGVSTIKADANGVWAAGVTTYPVIDNLDVLGRLGYDFGDDEGALIGIGVVYAFSDMFMLRGEYVVRDETNSLQLNFVFSPK